VRGQARIDMDIFIARHQLKEEHGNDFAITTEALWAKMIENGGRLLHFLRFFELFLVYFCSLL
jgi:hypothetical protein